MNMTQVSGRLSLDAGVSADSSIPYHTTPYKHDVDQVKEAVSARLREELKGLV
jgi:hypothetical protein